MKNKYYKTKIFKLSVAVAVMFLYLSYPVLASEITGKKVIELVNEARKIQGVGALEENELLNRIAADKLDDMVKNNYFAHTSPKGVTPWNWYEKNNYDYKYAGENLAINFLRAEDQQKAWMNSPTHRKNILNTNYKEIGVAVGAGEINGQMSIITVQEFGTNAAGTVPSKNGENFSAKKSEGDSEKISTQPQVLSVKDFTEKNLKNNQAENNSTSNVWKNVTGKFNGNKDMILEYSSTLSVFLLMLSIILSAASFLAIAGHELKVCFGIRKKIKICQH